MNVPHPIPYQGSKRKLAPAILSCFPRGVVNLWEPFAGSAAVSLAAAAHGKAKRFHLNDANTALMKTWNLIINAPEKISAQYTDLWAEQKGREKTYYALIRQEFNKTRRADHFLYLLARCVKASIRYNANGEFNQSPDNRRKGMSPAVMHDQVVRASRLLKNRSVLSSLDYRVALRGAKPCDIVYMDPPYQGVCGNRDPRYIERVAFEEFVESLDELNRHDISYIVSYDGRTGSKSFGKPLPSFLELTHIEVEAGRSTQATLLGQDKKTYESLYLSRALVSRIKALAEARQEPMPEYVKAVIRRQMDQINGGLR